MEEPPPEDEPAGSASTTAPPGADKRIDVLLEEYRNLYAERRTNQHTANALFAVLVVGSATLLGAAGEDLDRFFWVLPPAQFLIILAYAHLQVWALRITLHLAILEERIDTAMGRRRARRDSQTPRKNQLMSWHRLWLQPSRRLKLPLRRIVGDPTYRTNAVVYGTVLAVMSVEIVLIGLNLPPSWCFWYEALYWVGAGALAAISMYAGVLLPLRVLSRYDEELLAYDLPPLEPARR